MSKRKATSQGGRRRPNMTTDYVEDVSAGSSPTPNTTTTQFHVHIAESRSTTSKKRTISRSTVTTTGSPTKSSWSTHSKTDQGLPYPDNDGLDPSYVYRIEDLSHSGKLKRPRPTPGEALRQWLPLRETFLDELHCLDGRGQLGEILEGESDPSDGKCLRCPLCRSDDHPAVYRCRDCYGGELVCKGCLVLLHGRNPLHRIQQWDGDCFLQVTLQSLGFRVQLGHQGRSCVNPKPADKGFLVLDTNGIQGVSLDFCGCDLAEMHYIQLLRAEWFPATVVNPSSVATFRCLEFFHLATLQAKMSAYHFYSTLERLTDNTDLERPPDRYEELLRMARQWRHLKQLKRGGRGLFPDGINTTSEGELAVPCPACPHPGINLPPGWKNATPEQKWLYRPILSMDANFRLRRKDISTDAADPPLANGWSYFVELHGYKEHIAKYKQQKDTSACSNLAALGQANTRGGKGLATSGVGACVCARHQLLRANGVCDLQRGERYCNMDYVLLSALRGEDVEELVVSYDIACQWYKNLEDRMSEMPRRLQRDLDKLSIRFVIPKFHLPGHGLPCHIPFSFNFCEGVGRTDGEGIERDWSIINPVSHSTKEMTPGHRTDTLNDHWGDWNWHKICGMGRAFTRKMRAAIPERLKHLESFRTMSDSLPSTRIAEWTEMVQTWEEEVAVKLPRDVKAVNPYLMTSTEISQADVRLRLAQDDAIRAAAGEIAMHTVTPAQYVMTGLELEEHQHRIREDGPELMDGTTAQRASLQERRNLLRRKIRAWETIQAIYMPGVVQLRINIDTNETGLAERPLHVTEPEHYPLFLPSQVPDREGMILTAIPLRSIELQLREAQAHDALREIRHYLRILSFMWKDKNKNVRGQRENTRSQTLIKRTEAKKRSSMRRYCRAWLGLRALAPDGDWTQSLQELKDGDVRGLADPVASETEGRRTVSWIWTNAGIGTGSEADDAALHESLRVEWCKARSRARRWTEELQLLREEMRRVRAWLTWKSTWWREHARLRDGLSPQMQEGIRAYALRQARLLDKMCHDFTKMWGDTDAWADDAMVAAEGTKKKD